jgi:hydroxymethylpyrimidine/phosphomethylpyrimidine kinase
LKEGWREIIIGEVAMTLNVALTIAGSDPSGGAGIQADLKTFHQFGVFGISVIALLTVQNTQRVSAVETMPVQLVAAQLDAVLEDIPPRAAKTGALGNEEIIRLIGGKAANFPFPLVVDPVRFSKHGAPLMSVEAKSALVACLLPKAYLVTPNLHEAEELAGFAVTDLASMEKAARRIADFGARGVLVKGGHLGGEAVDVLYWEGTFRHFAAPRIDTPHTHGTGCTYSAAITASLANGHNLQDAIGIAKRYITLAIQSHPGLGKGIGPVNHFATV